MQRVRLFLQHTSLQLYTDGTCLHRSDVLLWHPLSIMLAMNFDATALIGVHSLNLYLYRRVCVYPSKHIYVAVCGPIGTKFGTHMQIHLEKVVGKIKSCPV